MMQNETCIYFITISPPDIIQSLLRANGPQLEAATQALSNFSTRRGGGAHPESGCYIYYRQHYEQQSCQYHNQLFC